jgi:nucleotide-binding universal stress UspA family protein
MVKRILIPVDFSRPSLAAFDYAITFGQSLGAELVLLHVVEPFYFSGVNGMYGVGFDTGAVSAELERAAHRQLARLTARLRARHMPARSLVEIGPAWQVIVDTATKLRADMIIMATHGRTGLSHLLLGSVAERVVRSAPCAVLTLRPPARSERQAGRASGRQAPRAARSAPKRPRRTAHAAAPSR